MILLAQKRESSHAAGTTRANVEYPYRTISWLPPCLPTQLAGKALKRSKD